MSSTRWSESGWAATSRATPFASCSPTTLSTAAGNSPGYGATEMAPGMPGSVARSFACPPVTAPPLTSHPCSVWPAGDIVERRGDLGWQRLAFDREGRGQLTGGTGAEQGSGDAGSVAYPEQGHLEWAEI